MVKNLRLTLVAEVDYESMLEDEERVADLLNFLKLESKEELLAYHLQEVLAESVIKVFKDDKFIKYGMDIQEIAQEETVNEQLDDVVTDEEVNYNEEHPDYPVQDYPSQEEELETVEPEVLMPVEEANQVVESLQNDLLTVSELGDAKSITVNEKLAQELNIMQNENPTLFGIPAHVEYMHEYYFINYEPFGETGESHTFPKHD